MRKRWMAGLPKGRSRWWLRAPALGRATVLLLLAGFGSGCTGEAPAPGRPGGSALSLQELLGGVPEAGFARALGPREFTFPADHGPHPEFRSEWWYFVGHLAAADGRRFGYQLTLFRNALSPSPPSEAAAPDGESSSSWRTNQAYMGHFSLTDVAGERFFTAERFARGALGLAGARSAPVEVWLEDWRIEQETPEEPRFRLAASAEGVELDLRLQAVKPLVLQGEEGLSRKGVQPGNASYYYSMTRLETVGEIRLSAERLPVTGLSWLDREWSTSVLEEGQVGWDWFALQLDDGRELMLYQLRRADGSPHPSSSGVRIARDGSSVSLAAEEFSIVALEEWKSPHSSIRYPAAWRIEIPEQGLRLEVEPLVADQELRHSVTYWEGAVSVRGDWAGAAISGRGYAELTGYKAR